MLLVEEEEEVVGLMLQVVERMVGHVLWHLKRSRQLTIASGESATPDWEQ